MKDSKTAVFHPGTHKAVTETLGVSVPVKLPTGLVPEPENGAELPEPIQKLSKEVRQGIDLIQLGTSVVEAGRIVGLSAGRLHAVARSDLGIAYAALQYEALSGWMRGMLFRAAAVFEAELTSANTNARMRAAESIFKHLGNLLGLGQAKDGESVDATKLARAIMEAGGININLNVNAKGNEPEVILIGEGKE